MRVSLGAICAAFLLAPSAWASSVPEPPPRATLRGELVAPQLVPGGGLAWMDTECLRDCNLDYDAVERSSAYEAPRAWGRRRTVLRRQYLGEDAPARGFSFALTRQALALVRRDDFGSRYGLGPDVRVTPWLGSPVGPLRPVRGCGPIGEEIAVSGDALLLTEQCADASTRLVSHRPDGTSRVVWAMPRPADARRPATGEPLFAIKDLQTRDGYVVFSAAPWSAARYDYGASRVVLVRLADGVELRSWQTPANASLGDDGDVALSATVGAPRSCLSSVLIHHLDRPEPERVSPPFCTTLGPRLSAGRAWFVVLGSRGSRIVGIDGAGRVETRVDLGRTDTSDLLVDERSLAWVATGCNGSEAIRVVPVAVRVAAPGVTSCPARPARKLVRVRRDEFGRTIASVVLRCPRGCSGKLGVRKGGRALQAFTTDFQQTGRLGRHEIILNARARRLLKPSGRVRAMVRVRRVDRDVPVPGPREYPVTLTR